MTPIQLIGRASPFGNSRETFRKSGTDGSNPVPSSGESAANSIFEIPGLLIAICPPNRRSDHRLFANCRPGSKSGMNAFFIWRGVREQHRAKLQKAQNLARDDRISLTIDHDTSDPMAITGLSMAAHARAVDDPAEVKRALKKVIRPKPSEKPKRKP
jgi:hypothetical protein